MNIIVAVCKNRGIGINGTIPWKLREDMKFFRNKTIGNGNNAIIMGRKTYESLDYELPKRDNYVISSSKLTEKTYSNLVEANYEIMTKKELYDDVWVIGGGEIYKWYINNNLIRDVYVTNIFQDYECDSFFPELPNSFEKIQSGDTVFSKENNIPYNIDIYRNNYYGSKNHGLMSYDFLQTLDKIDKYGVV